MSDIWDRFKTMASIVRQFRDEHWSDDVGDQDGRTTASFVSLLDDYRCLAEITDDSTAKGPLTRLTIEGLDPTEAALVVSLITTFER